jgi:hypothetical protein
MYGLLNFDKKIYNNFYSYMVLLQIQTNNISHYFIFLCSALISDVKKISRI